MVVLLARESREVVHDDEVDFTLMRAAVLQQCLELTAVRGLGALAFFVEAFEDLVALATAVLLAGTELGRQTEVLRLLLRTDANVDHRADHRASDIAPPCVGAAVWVVREDALAVTARVVQETPKCRGVSPRRSGRGREENPGSGP